MAIILPSPTKIKLATMAEVGLPSFSFSDLLDGSSRDFTLCLPWDSGSFSSVPVRRTASIVFFVSRLQTVSVSLDVGALPGT